MKYVIIILSDDSPSFCQYSIEKKDIVPTLMPIETLKQSILLAMKENAIIQFLYPNYTLPEEYYKIIKYTNHVNILPFSPGMTGNNIFNVDITKLPELKLSKDDNIIIRATLEELIQYSKNIEDIIPIVSRINLVIIQLKVINDYFIKKYHEILSKLSKLIVDEYIKGHYIQFNGITDLIHLQDMNNCNAGVDSITISPTGDIFICPGFYYDEIYSVGNVFEGYNILNEHLYNISYAPICRLCDCFHCKRCIWSNIKSTHEVNTPSHEQCVTTHIERNISASFIKELQKFGLSNLIFNKIDHSDIYDPFYKLPRLRLK